MSMPTEWRSLLKWTTLTSCPTNLFFYPTTENRTISILLQKIFVLCGPSTDQTSANRKPLILKPIGPTTSWTRQQLLDPEKRPKNGRNTKRVLFNPCLLFIIDASVACFNNKIDGVFWGVG